MKKIYVLFAFVTFVMSNAQCTITGADQIQVGEKQTYSVLNSDLSCVDCYQWTHQDQKIILETETNHNPLIVKGTVIGPAILSLEIKMPESILKCQKTIQVIEPTSADFILNSQKCIFNIESFNEVRLSDNLVSFEPETSESDWTFQWTATYKDGGKKVSNQKNGQFEFSLERAISQVELRITQKNCKKRIIKNYDANFWYFF